MKSTVEIRLFKLLQSQFTEEQSHEIVGEIKSMTQDDLAERIESKVISTMTWRLLFFFFAQISFTLGLLKIIGVM